MSTCRCVKLFPDSCLFAQNCIGLATKMILPLQIVRHTLVHLFTFSILAHPSVLHPSSHLPNWRARFFHSQGLKHNITCPTPRSLSYSQITERSEVQESKKRVTEWVMASGGKCEWQETVGIMGTVNSDTLSRCEHRLADTVAHWRWVKMENTAS